MGNLFADLQRNELKFGSIDDSDSDSDSESENEIKSENEVAK